MLNHKLSIITVGYQNFNEIVNTIKSIDSQSVKPFENILILKGLKDEEKNSLLRDYTKPYRSFFFDLDSSLTNISSTFLSEFVTKFFGPFIET